MVKMMYGILAMINLVFALNPENYNFVKEFAPVIWLAEGAPFLRWFQSTKPANIEAFLNYTTFENGRLSTGIEKHDDFLHWF